MSDMILRENIDYLSCTSRDSRRFVYLMLGVKRPGAVFDQGGDVIRSS